jgi:integrase
LRIRRRAPLERRSKELISNGTHGAEVVFERMPRIERFYRDLKKAGIPLQDSFGRKAVFHSLRHTFGTNLARGRSGKPGYDGSDAA